MNRIDDLINATLNTVAEIIDDIRYVFGDWLFWIVVVFAGVATFTVLSSKQAWSRDVSTVTATTPFNPTDAVDQWGYVYPKECRRDLTFLLNKVILDETKSLEGWAPTGRYVGYFELPSKSRLGIVFVDRAIRDPEIRKKIIHHELCHAYMHFKHGNAYWHPD